MAIGIGVGEGKIALCLFQIRRKIDSIISKSLNYLKCRLWGIEIGEKCNFWGVTTFYKTPGSKISIGDNCRFRSSKTSNFRGINHPCIIQTTSARAEVLIGSKCGFSGTSIVCGNRITIEDNVICGANTQIADRDGHADRYELEEKPVFIGHDTWLGMNVIVLKGVRIGHHVIVGAGSIVTKDIPDYCVAAGNPAKIIRKTNEEV